MRNPKRINRLLRLIKKIWVKYPDLRLFQLLGNPFSPQNIFNGKAFTDRDYYYIEDDTLEVRLREYYKMKGNDEC